MRLSAQSAASLPPAVCVQRIPTLSTNVQKQQLSNQEKQQRQPNRKLQLKPHQQLTQILRHLPLVPGQQQQQQQQQPPPPPPPVLLWKPREHQQANRRCSSNSVSFDHYYYCNCSDENITETATVNIKSEVDKGAPCQRPKLAATVASWIITSTTTSATIATTAAWNNSRTKDIVINIRAKPAIRVEKKTGIFEQHSKLSTCGSKVGEQQKPAPADVQGGASGQAKKPAVPTSSQSRLYNRWQNCKESNFAQA
ncbi:integrator complex subunit 3 homolog isoform X2 [Varroa jacobsoni]|uniref:integrator complex subunit 3 homolog isoform X2 n=1 Tax=Varroa jacobsoni TaxID=62625 RepID=UPI000BF4F5A2|nr:integrator complex subunit 3 homolog isoform X2 [Varroa jacobsoni]